MRSRPLVFLALLLPLLLAPALAPRAAGAAAPPSTVAGGLRVMHTARYRVHTDLEYALAEDLGRRMDAMYDEYARRLSNFDAPRSGSKFDVYLFARRKDYLKFVGPGMANTFGVTVPDLNIVASFLEEQGRDNLRATLKHEAFHQFAHSVIHKNLPPWLDEGMAVMFQEGIWTGRSFRLGQVPPRRVRQLRHDIANGRVVDFRQMMILPLEQWNAATERDRFAGGRNYNQSWAMCHFLVYAGEDGKPKYRARFLDMLKRIQNGTDASEAFKQAFSPNVEGFQAKFTQWASTLSATPDATLIERQNILADVLAMASKRGRRFDAVAEFRDAMVRTGWQGTYSNGDLEWETDPNPRVYFRALDGRDYARDEFYFDLRPGAPLPDVVLNSPGQIRLRTVFHDKPGGGGIEHEVLVEGAAR